MGKEVEDRCLFIYLFIYLFVYLFVCLFIYLWYRLEHLKYSLQDIPTRDSTFWSKILIFKIILMERMHIFIYIVYTYT